MDQVNLQKVINHSRDALLSGDEPFAASIYVPNHFHLYAQNRVVRDQNPAAHAEILVLDLARNELGKRYDVKMIKRLMKESTVYPK